MSTALQFRNAVADDIHGILALWKTADATPSISDTTDDVGRVIDLKNVAFVLAVSDLQIVGSIIASYDGWRGNMYRLAVDPEYRRQGIASELVAIAETRFAEWGVKRVTVLVEREHPWAMGFWNAVGYAVDEKMGKIHS
jgi:ribosomal protein S18 acetylase RimI-like enzyme